MKNLLSNIVAIILVVGTAINAYLESLCADCEISVWTMVIGIVGAVIAYLTGKSQNLKKKMD